MKNKIEVLGTGSGLAYGVSVSMLIWNEEETSAILLDCGCLVYSKLVELEKTTNRKIIEKIDQVFISHLHSDHVGSLGLLLGHRFFLQGFKETYLSGVDCKEYLQLTSTRECDFEVSKSINKPYSIETITTRHVPQMPSVAGLIFEEIFYSGDTGYSLLQTEQAKKAKIIIHEASLVDSTLYTPENLPPLNEENKYIHVGIDTLAKESSKEVRAKTWLTHYLPQNTEIYETKAKELGFAGVLKEGQIINI